MPTPDQTFRDRTGHAPHPWQAALAQDPICRDRLIRIPTGFGKTHGILLAWLHHRVVAGDDRWPRRLVWCLPMRVLVEQTEAEVRRILGDLAWDGIGDHTGKVGVHLLMGGADAGEWHLHPEQPAVLIGTQDMLLSRALNRGYASPRARWPMEFGLLNHDALWVMDEVQLMDVGLATSAQLQAFRAEDAAKGLRPCHTWWMSATLQPEWLRSVDTVALVDGIAVPPDRILSIPAGGRTGGLWDVTKSLASSDHVDATAVARQVMDRHQAMVPGPYGRISLVILNTVDRAVEVHAALAKHKPTDLRLIHSRFRAAERAAWRDAFLAREHCRPETDRIIVATQVVEAGVDISAGNLVTDLAPWPSMVQRFGRAARYGGTAQVTVLIPALEDDKSALPYQRADLVGARDLAVSRLTDVSPRSLESFEEALPAAERSALYPYAPDHLLLRQEWDELFDTAPDLAGADLDISRFIRSGDERDCQVFWASWDGHAPADDLQPARLALCPVPFLRAREWLCGKGKEVLKERGIAFVQDYLDGGWREAKARDLFPGRVVLVAASFGGYRPDIGFTGDKLGKRDPTATPVPPVLAPADARSDGAEDREDLSATRYQTVGEHGGEVGGWCAELGRCLGLSSALIDLLAMAGRWHDVGKAHPAFQGSIQAADRPQGEPLAKAPTAAWVPVSKLYDAGPTLGRRQGFRHEWASALAALELLARTKPEHPALRGGYEGLVGTDALAGSVPVVTGHPLADELVALDAEQIDLLLYLIAAHHGKLRATVQASPADQTFPRAATLGHPLRGVCDGDPMPAMLLPGRDGAQGRLPELTLRLDVARLGLSPRYGRSWRERTVALQHRWGPGALAWLETLVRTADVRASRSIRCAAGVAP
ncbi:MAG: hypothetical protein RLZZ127_2673 [Planctomycetota bacterium]|jgi:CRISPR-associated endonuclease/helicase Cas3